MPKPEHKAINLTIPSEAPAGTIHAVFSTFNRLDKQRDIVKRSAFADLDGAPVPLIWSHDWGAMAVGKGVIRVQPQQAVFEGAFHLQTEVSRDAYATVKAMGDLQEYSYGFEIAPDGYQLDEQADGLVRIITKMSRVFEVSPVLVGAGEDTRTLAIKSEDGPIWETEDSPVGEKPFPNEHACRLRDPGGFQANTFRRTTRQHDGKTYSIIMGRLKGETTMTEQAYRYPKAAWTAAAARAHCSSHDGSSFVAATSSSSYTLDVEIDGQKLGRTISARSEAAIRAAITALQGLLGEEASADDDAKAMVASLPLADGVAHNQVDPVALADGLRGWVAWLAAEPLDSQAADEWLPSMLARVDDLRRVAGERIARRSLSPGASTADVYARLAARQARLAAVLGKGN